MNGTFVRFVLIGMFVACASAGAFAQQPEVRVALVIGNAAYKEAPLANPVNDATDIAKVLADLGFKVILKRDANQRDMRQAVREFGAELRRAQVGLFYYAGHGLQVRGNNYLVPVEADINNEADAEDLAVDAQYVLRTMEEAQIQVSIVIMDACRNNPFSRGFRSVSRGLAQMSAPTGSLIAFSTAPGSVAADGVGRNGTYTKHLLSSLNQPDTDMLKVFQRVRAGVVKETGGKQTPWESTSLVGDFYFRPGAAAPSAASARITDPAAIETEFWISVKDSRSVEEIQAYIDQYPNGRFVTLARARMRTMEAQSRPQQSRAEQAHTEPPVQVAAAPPLQIEVAPPLQIEVAPPIQIATAPPAIQATRPPPSAQTTAAPAAERRVVTFAEGHRYDGEFRNNAPNGRGILIYPNGDRYEGQFVNGQRHGRGSITFADGVRYEGDWRDDRIIGRGIMTWPNGDRYDGQLSDGIRQGRGLMMYGDRGQYDGEWRDNYANGKGVMVWPNGQRYEGQWLNGNRHGYGTHDFAPGSRYEGEWRDDKPVNVNAAR